MKDDRDLLFERLRGARMLLGETTFGNDTTIHARAREFNTFLALVHPEIPLEERIQMSYNMAKEDK